MPQQSGGGDGRHTDPGLAARLGIRRAVAPSSLLQGFLTVVFGYGAARHGLSVAAIGAVVGAGLLASPMKLLWTPLVDLALTLKSWVVAATLATALLTVALALLPVGAGNIALVAAFAFASAAAGSVVGGSDRIASLLATSGALVAAAVLLAVLPRPPLCFAAGTLVYAFCLGCCYTAFTALQFETIGQGAAASKYCALNAIGNVPVSYMPVVLGLVHDRSSTTTMLWFEAIATTGFILAFALARPRAAVGQAAHATPVVA